MSEQRRRGPMGGHGRMMSGEKAKDFKGSMAKLFRYMGRYKFRFILMFIFAVAGTVFSIVGPKILGKATTELFNGLVAKVNGTGEIDFGKIGMILLWTLGLYVLSACFSFVQGFVMSGISNDVTYNLRKDISKKINRLPLNYYESRTNGEILSRITNDVDTLQMSLNQSLTQLITSVTTLIGVFIMMLSINVWMTLAALLILPVSMFIIQTVMKHSQKYFQDQQSYLGKVNGQIEENFGGHNVVRVFNKENDVVEEFEKDNQKLYESAWKSQFFSGMMMPIMQFVGNLGYVMVALLGGVFVIKGSIEVGDIQSFFQYIRNFTQPIQQIAQVTNLLQSSAAASERVFEFLDEEEEVQQPENPDSIEGLNGNVQFEHVEFGYNPDKIIVHDFSADVHDGQKVAIVGPTGAGKTLSSLRFALYHAKKMQKQRIFYIAPFNSILEQNADEIRKATGMPSAILEHHCNVICEDDEEEKYRSLTETWDSPIVVTTAVQILNTLFSGQKSCIRRMHSLCNSIIIFDEVQAIPTRCTELFNLAVNFLSQFCDTTVVLCSATQPTLALLKENNVCECQENLKDMQKLLSALRLSMQQRNQGKWRRRI